MGSSMIGLCMDPSMPTDSKGAGVWILEMISSSSRLSRPTLWAVSWSWGCL